MSASIVVSLPLCSARMTMWKEGTALRFSSADRNIDSASAGMGGGVDFGGGVEVGTGVEIGGGVAEPGVRVGTRPSQASAANNRPTNRKSKGRFIADTLARHPTRA